MQMRVMPRGQDWLIKRIQALNLKSNENGTCFGVACVGAVAILDDSVDQLDAGCQTIYAIPTKDFAKTVAEHRLTSKGRKTVLIQTVKSLHSVELCQNASDYTAFYPDSAQSEIKVNSNILSHVLFEITPKRLKKQGGAVNCGHVLFEILTRERLTVILNELLVKIAKHELKTPIAFVIQTSSHAFTLGYNPIKKIWQFIDANNLPSKTFKTDEINLLANQVINSSLYKNKCLLRFEATCHANSREVVNTLLSDWQKAISDNQQYRIKEFDFRDEKGFTLLSFTASYGTQEQTLNLIQEGADPAIQVNPSNITTMVCNRKISTIKLFLKHIPTVEPKSLNAALFINDYVLAIKLVKKISDVNYQIRSWHNCTPLHIAVKMKQPKLVAALLKRGALSYVYNDNEETPLSLAVESKQLDIIDLLFTVPGKDPSIFNSKNQSPFLSAVKSGNYKLFKKLVRRGASYLPDHPRGFAPLLKAIKYYDPDEPDTKKILSACLDLIDININIPNYHITPLYYAAKYNQEAVKVLIAKGANVNLSVHKNAETPLLVALKEGNTKTVALLLKMGANPNLAAGIKRKSPLLMAIKHNPQSVYLLLKHGANPNPILNSSAASELKALRNSNVGVQFYIDYIEMLAEFYKKVRSEENSDTKRYIVMQSLFKKIKTLINNSKIGDLVSDAELSSSSSDSASSVSSDSESTKSYSDSSSSEKSSSSSSSTTSSSDESASEKEDAPKEPRFSPGTVQYRSTLFVPTPINLDPTPFVTPAAPDDKDSTSAGCEPEDETDQSPERIRPRDSIVPPEGEKLAPVFRPKQDDNVRLEHSSAGSSSTSSGSDSSSDSESIVNVKTKLEKLIATIREHFQAFIELDSQLQYVIHLNMECHQKEIIDQTTFDEQQIALEGIYTLSQLPECKNMDNQYMEMRRIHKKLSQAEQTSLETVFNLSRNILASNSFKNLLKHANTLALSTNASTNTKGVLIRDYVNIIVEMKTPKEMRLWLQKLENFQDRFSILLVPRNSTMFQAPSAEETTSFRLFTELKKEVAELRTSKAPKLTPTY